MKLRCHSPYARHTVLVGAIALATAVFAFTSLVPGTLAVAAPRSGSRPSPALSLNFNVTARFAAARVSSGTAVPEQMLSATVWIKGNRTRIGTRLGDQPVVFLYASPYLYKLLPASRAGVRWRADRTSQEKATRNFDMQTLLRDPLMIRTALQQGGARRAGSTRLNGVPAEVFTARNFMGQGQAVKVWLRQSDLLPLRLEATSKALSSTVSWRGYRRGPLPDSLFQAPAGYNIREARGQPRIM